MQDPITHYDLPGPRVFPESIGVDPASGDFYVGSLADGSIYRRTAITYQEGLNLNGIGMDADGRYLVVDQTNTGRLFRVDVATKAVAEIDLAGRRLEHCDGLLLDSQTLYVVRNALNLLVTIRLAPDLLSGRVVASETHAAFDFPTALARVGDRLLVVNGQLQRMGPDQSPALPFTVVAVPMPAQQGGWT